LRIVVLADIHGNLPAFQAVLDELPRLHADHVVVLGDVVNGAPDSAACWQLVKTLKCPIVKGNHEGYVADYGRDGHDPKWELERFGPLRWTLDQLSSAEVEEIRSLPQTYQFDAWPELLFVHASARSDRDTILGYTPEADVDAMFPNVNAQWIFRGHNHVCNIRFWHDRLIVTSGSIGLPLDGRTVAQFAVLDWNGNTWQVHHRSVPYDVDAALKRFDDSGYMDVAGPMARIFKREVATAGHTLMSFMQLYQKWSKQGETPLGEAVDRYFTLC